MNGNISHIAISQSKVVGAFHSLSGLRGVVLHSEDLMLMESQSDDVGVGIGAGAAYMSVLSLSSLWLLGKGVRLTATTIATAKHSPFCKFPCGQIKRFWRWLWLEERFWLWLEEMNAVSTINIRE